MRSRYNLFPTTSSFCPTCHGPVTLLGELHDTSRRPSFYICFGCQFVGQVGVGPVERFSEDVLAPNDSRLAGK